MKTQLTDLLVLSDGTVLAHNLTPVMATLLHKLNPKDEAMRLRTRTDRKPLSSSTANRQANTTEGKPQHHPPM